MKKLIFLFLVIVVMLGMALPISGQTLAPQPEGATAPVPYVPVPPPSQGFSQDVLITILGLLLPWLVIFIRWVCARFGWALDGANAKLLVGVLSAIFTVVVMLIYHAFGNVHGWALVMAIITRLSIIIGMAEIVYGQIISRIPQTAKLAAAQKPASPANQ